MADVFLIVALTVAFFILLVVAVYLLVYYSHPDDRNEAYFPKIVVIIGIMLAGATCLLLPLDVANNEGYAGTLCCDTYRFVSCRVPLCRISTGIYEFVIDCWVFVPKKKDNRSIIY